MKKALPKRPAGCLIKNLYNTFSNIDYPYYRLDGMWLLEDS
jgi:hypothetical protein